MKANRVIPKILIIDDDKFFLEFYRAELAQFNLDTDFATDGDEGLAKAKEILPDAILLDVILPKRDGFEVLTELKKDPATSGIPVIINSSLGEQSDVDKLLKLGAVAAFNKLTQLPREVVAYVQGALKKCWPETTAPTIKPPATADTKLSAGQIDELFEKSLAEIANSLQKLFHKESRLEDMNAVILPYAKFKDHIAELSKLAGTLFIYSKIEATVSGVAILSMKRDATLSLIKLIEQGAAGKDLGLGMSDQVIEEFVNIIFNAFLTRLSTSINGKFLLSPATITSPTTMNEILEKAKIDQNNLVVFLEQSYAIEQLDLNFSLFIIFGGQILEETHA